MYNYQREQEIKQTLQSLNFRERKDLIKSILLLNNSLSQTIGPDWLNKVTGEELPWDIVAIMAGRYEPDEKGILQLR